MANLRKDTIDKYYKAVNFTNNVSTGSFWLSVGLSVLIFFVINAATKNILNILFIVITIIYAISSNLASLYLLPRAEDKRRGRLLSDSLGIALDDEETNKYYNNKETVSIFRLGVNCFENSLFSKTVSGKMLIKQAVTVAVYLLIWIVLLLIRDTPLDFISIVAQTLFTSSLLINFIKLWIYFKGVEGIYREFRNLFLGAPNKDDTYTISRILDLVFQYESIKARTGISLSTKIFEEINPETSGVWKKIKDNLSIK